MQVAQQVDHEQGGVGLCGGVEAKILSAGGSCQQSWLLELDLKGQLFQPVGNNWQQQQK